MLNRGRPTLLLAVLGFTLWVPAALAQDTGVSQGAKG